MEERKKNGVCSKLEYFDWYIKHERNCFTNHDGGAQVTLFCKEFSLSLQNITVKTFCMTAGYKSALFFFFQTNDEQG